MKCQWGLRTNLKSKLRYSTQLPTIQQTGVNSPNEVHLNSCSEFMLCKWYRHSHCWCQPTGVWLDHVWLLIFTITDCFATSGLVLRIAFSFWMNVYVGGVVVEESVKCATHSRLKQSHNPSEEYWWVEACLANLPNHLTVTKHTHRSRHGSTKHWQSLCLTEGGSHSSSKKIFLGKEWQNYKGTWSWRGRERDRNCTITKAISFLKTVFREDLAEFDR